MVNEVLPREKLIARAYEIADPHHDSAAHHAPHDRTDRAPPMAEALADTLDFGFATQLFAHLAKDAPTHGRKHISETVAYVRNGKRNNFDRPPLAICGEAV